MALFKTYIKNFLFIKKVKTTNGIKNNIELIIGFRLVKKFRNIAIKLNINVP